MENRIVTHNEEQPDSQPIRNPGYPVGAEIRNPLARLAARASQIPFFLGFALADHQRRNALNDQQLADHLGCELDSLPRLSLCRRPDAADPEFGRHVRQIAEYAPCDADALVGVLRQTSALAALRSDDSSQPDAVFLAARDRLNEDDPQHSESDEPKKEDS